MRRLRLDHGLGHQGCGVHLADPDGAVAGGDEDQQRVLGAVAPLRVDLVQPAEDGLDVGDRQVGAVSTRRRRVGHHRAPRCGCVQVWAVAASSAGTGSGVSTRSPSSSLTIPRTSVGLSHQLLRRGPTGHRADAERAGRDARGVEEQGEGDADDPEIVLLQVHGEAPRTTLPERGVELLGGGEGVGRLGQQRPVLGHVVLHRGEITQAMHQQGLAQTRPVRRVAAADDRAHLEGLAGRRDLRLVDDVGADQHAVVGGLPGGVGQPAEDGLDGRGWTADPRGSRTRAAAGRSRGGRRRRCPGGRTRWSPGRPAPGAHSTSAPRRPPPRLRAGHRPAARRGSAGWPARVRSPSVRRPTSFTTHRYASVVRGT